MKNQDHRNITRELMFSIPGYKVFIQKYPKLRRSNQNLLIENFPREIVATK